MLNEYASLFNEYGYSLNEAQWNKLQVYYDMLIEYNNKFNLTAVTDYDKVIKLHFLDSLLGECFLQKNAYACDVGSGAGFPGMILALIRPDINMVLIDSLSKRVNFLNAVAAALELNNITAIHMRAEDAGQKDFRSKFDFVTARAVAKLNILSEYCLPLVKRNGVFVAYKSDENPDESKNAIEILGGRISETKSFILPDGEKRNIIKISKVNDTPSKYPRGGNKPRISPL